MVQTSAQRALGVGPLHEHSATMRAYISEMRRRYISMWQLGLIAGILQLLLYLFAAHSLSADFQLAAAEGKYACALLVLAHQYAPVLLWVVASLALRRLRTLQFLDTLFERIVADESAAVSYTHLTLPTTPYV